MVCVFGSWEVAMRHDPASAAVVIMLRSLKMYGMAQAVTGLIEQGAPAFDAGVPILSQLLKAEMAEREVRSIAYHMKAARFPAYKDISGYDFAASEINRSTKQPCANCTDASSWTERRISCSSAGRAQENTCGDRPRRPGDRASPPKGPLLLDDRIGQCTRAGEGQRQGRPDR